VTPVANAAKTKTMQSTKDIRPGTTGVNSMPRNVNYYRHLLDSTASNETGIEWVLKLRSPTASDLEPYKKFE
jgi:hypothetical protein